MTRRLAAIACALAMLGLTAACGSSDEIPTSPGSPAVYKAIAALTTCPALQKQFQQAMTNADAREPGTEQRKWSVAYAEFANQRLEKLGCYK